MATDNQQTTGTAPNYESDRGGATLIKEPVIGIVKNNVDPTKSGRIQVYIAKFGSASPDDSKSWVTVSYLSPFCGLSGGEGGGTEGYGEYVGNPQSYGFWASAPDVGTQVLCIFVDGDTQNGFYIGCVPQAGMLNMTPAIGASTNIVPNDAEAKTYGGADRLPAAEINAANPSIANSGSATSEPKPVHSYQASILFDQGLLRDNSRGVISSSAQRETPSRVFGLSTPGAPIYSGGYTNNNIKEASNSADTSKLQTVGRTGGHSLVMDDGGLQGEDTLMRFRSSSGHMIMFNDTAQTVFVIHANGQSWIELGKEGTVDMYATNSVNIRTEGDFNVHADRDVNIHAQKNFNLYGDNINLEADTNLSGRSGSKLALHGVGGVGIKSDSTMGLTASGDAGFTASGTAFIEGAKVNLNTGSGPAASEVTVMPKTNHPDTAYSTEKGWIYPAPEALLSITSRAPAHQPWIGAGKGVDVKVDSAVDSGKPVTTKSVDAVNTSTSNVPKNPTTPTINSTVPPQKARNPVTDLNSSAVTSLAGQQASTNSTMPSGAPTPQAIRGDGTGRVPNTVNQAPASTFSLFSATPIPVSEGSLVTPTFLATPDTQMGGGILPGAGGVTLSQATAPGSILKPGSESLIYARMSSGMNPEQALQGLTTGNFGATSASTVLTSVSTQLSAVSTSINSAATSLVNSGILTGQESAAQAGGVVLAASNYGTGLVTSVMSGVQNTITGTIGAASGIVTGTAAAITSTIQGTVSQATQIIGGAQAAAGKISDAISGGNFAGKLSDTVSSGMAGLANSLSGSLNQLGSSVAGLAAGLSSSLRNAFNSVEASYKNLTAGAPNKLGGSAGVESAVDLNSTGAKYEAASAAFAAAQNTYDQALAAYRIDNSSENKTALDEADSALSSARKQAASASLGVVTGAVGSVVDGAIAGAKKFGNAISNAFSPPVTTANSGMNALPGGNSAITNQVTAGGENTLNNLTNGVAAAGGQVTNALSQPANLAGNLVQNTTQAITSTVNGVVNQATGIVTGTVNAVTGLVGGAVSAVTNTVRAVAAIPGQVVQSVTASANGIISSIQTSIASIGSMGGQIKASVSAIGTFDKSSMTSKTGELLGNSIVPVPTSVLPSSNQTSTPSDTPDESVAAKTTALKKLQDLKEQIAEVNGEIILTSRNRPNIVGSSPQANADYKSKIDALYDKRKKLENQQTEATAEFNGAVSNQNNVTPTPAPSSTPQSPRTSTGFADDGNNGLGYNPDGTPWGLK
jgi:uncharacterized protein YoxC